MNACLVNVTLGRNACLVMECVERRLCINSLHIRPRSLGEDAVVTFPGHAARGWSCYVKRCRVSETVAVVTAARAHIAIGVLLKLINERIPSIGEM